MAFKNPLAQAQALTLANPQAAITGGEPQIQAKPQRFTRRPSYEDYEIDDELKGKLDDYEHYHDIDDIDAAIKRATEGKQRYQSYNNPMWNDSIARYENDLVLLNNPKIQKYVNDRNAYNRQFEKDYDEYYPIAKEAVVRKLLSDGDLYRTEVHGQDYYDEIDDIGDLINDGFNKKYGYEGKYSGELFSPLRKHGGLYSALGNEQRLTDAEGRRNYRRTYNKSAYIGEMLRTGEITLDDLKRYILGK